ncbi:MAG: hypothetical protein ACP5K2_02240 [bacterium]
MEGAEKVLEEIYKTLGIIFTPKIVNIPVCNVKVKSLDISLATNILNYKIKKKIIVSINNVPILPRTNEIIKSKIASIPLIDSSGITSNLNIVNDIFIKRKPIPWRELPNDLKVKLLGEIKTKWPQYYQEGIKIIGIYDSIPIGKIKTLKVDENNGILSFNLKNEYTDEKRTNLLVFKFLKDDVLRSIAF